MKKIFGILSLIAILTVSFTATASTVDTDNANVVYDIGVDNLDIPTFDIVSVDAPTFDLSDLPLTLTTPTIVGLKEVPIVATNVDISLNYTLFAIGTDTNDVSDEWLEPVPNLNKFIDDFNDKFGYAPPLLVEKIATNIGKLTKFSLS